MKIYTYLVIMTFMTIIFTYLGLSTGSNEILDGTGLLTNPDGFTSSLLYTKLTAILAVAAVSAIIIGFFTKDSGESYIVSGFALFLLGFISSVISVLVKVQAEGGGSLGWAYMIAAGILIPFIVGYCVAMVEWWRGTD